MDTRGNSLTADTHATCCQLSPSSTRGQSWTRNPGEAAGGALLLAGSSSVCQDRKEEIFF